MNQDGGRDLRFATWKGIRENKGIEDVISNNKNKMDGVLK